ncbi:MAG TPA: PfkB family carbohydrate kinase [Pseudolabrys sp.]|nr:PfkB family carbohydrate kinase [Pseudolabrys sp.]
MTDRASRKPAPTILCAGIAVQDIVMRVERFPEPGSKIYASEYITTGGGCAANAAVTIARICGHARFAGPLGDDNDEASRSVVAALTRESVDCSGVLRVGGGSASVSLILLDAAGEKEIATRRGNGLTTAAPTDPARLVADVDAVLVDNRFPAFATPICQAAVARGIPVIVDLDQAMTPDDPLLALGSHVIASAEGLRGTMQTQDITEALPKLATHLKGFAAVTDGPAGVFFMKGVEVRHMPAFKVDAIDTLGAGDAFHGAFTLSLIESGDVIQAMRFASAAAAIKCTRFGGLTGAPTRAEIHEFLTSRAAR